MMMSLPDDASDFKKVVENCHKLLDEAGVEPCVDGTPCDNLNCDSKLYHRIHLLIQERNDYNKATKSLWDMLKHIAKRLEDDEIDKLLSQYKNLANKQD